MLPPLGNGRSNSVEYGFGLDMRSIGLIFWAISRGWKVVCLLLGIRMNWFTDFAFRFAFITYANHCEDMHQYYVSA